jgi:hypothetical protein
MSKRMGSVDTSTLMIPWWFSTVLREPGAVVESRGNRAEEKPLTLWPLLEHIKVSQTRSESRDTRVAQTLTQTKAIQRF